MTHRALKLQCVGCGATYDPPRLHCDHCDGLLRSRFSTLAFHPNAQSNLFSFQAWLPLTASSDVAIGTTVYPSKGLADHLGLSDLCIAFSGYAPGIGALNPTGSFKDFEAIPSLLYYREHDISTLVLASAGNTARAFAYAAVQLDYPVLIVVPESALPRLWIPCQATDAVRLVVLEGCDDYATAIRIADLISETLEIQNEGGARNVARRDGMSTTLLEYAKQMASLPSHYFQAVGSGTGAIATWEAAQRLIAAGVGNRLPILHLSQNAPFTPLHDAWALGNPIEPDEDIAGQLERIGQIDAIVLANRMPPYALPGGVRDALASTDGQTYSATNEEARAASVLFEEAEGLPIGPAAAVSTAALIQAVRMGRIAPDDATLLHITGNNESLLQHDLQLHRIQPVWRVRPEAVSAETIHATANRLLSSS